MIKYFKILFLCFLPATFIGQPIPVQKDTTTTLKIGFNAGTIFTKLIINKDFENPTYTISNPLNKGFSSGLSISSNFKSFFFRIAFNYDYIKYQVKYLQYFANPVWGSADTANYDINSSLIDFSFSPGLFIGNKKQFYVLAGFYGKIPLNQNIKGQIIEDNLNPGRHDTIFINNNINDKTLGTGGLIIGTGVLFHIKNNEFSIEIKAGHNLSSQIFSSWYYTKEYFIIANINYFIKILN